MHSTVDFFRQTAIETAIEAAIDTAIEVAKCRSKIFAAKPKMRSLELSGSGRKPVSAGCGLKYDKIWSILKGLKPG